MIKVNHKRAVEYASRLVTDWEKEHVIGVYVGARLNLIRAEVIGIGTLTGHPTHAREVFKPAILASAHGVILLHNHPSDELTPSQNDKLTTKQLIKAGELLGLPLEDHIIFNRFGEFYSVRLRKKGGEF